MSTLDAIKMKARSNSVCMVQPTELPNPQHFSNIKIIATKANADDG